MDKVVFEDGTAAYSDSASDRLQVPWLSNVLSDHAALVNTAVQSLNFTDIASYFNVDGTIYATAADLTQRQAACNTWITAHDHMVISDGAYYLDSHSAVGKQAILKAFRDPTYPFSAGTWAYGRATPPEITKVGIPTVVPGGAASFVVELSGAPPMGVKYLIRDPLTGMILDIGSADAITASKFVISLSAEFTSDMDPGLYEPIRIWL
jgi:peptide/nickel transport system substrate-binding protein